MRMTRIFLFVLFATLTFGACSSDKDENIINNLEQEYFTIHDATFVESDIPTGTDNFITSLSINKNVINGGTSIISLTSTEELSALHVGVKDVKGYYEYPLATTRSVRADETATYNYDVVIIVTQNISVKDFILAISAVSKKGGANAVLNSETISVIEAGTGDLQVSLSWDLEDDVDLHIYDPSGNHICYYKKFRYDEQDNVIAELDIDSNAGCSIDGVKNENIFYNKAENGVYGVYVNLWEKCVKNRLGSKYSVSINFKGNYIKISDTMRGQFDAAYLGNWKDNEDKYVKIGTFTITNGNIAAGGVHEIPTNDNTRSTAASKERMQYKSK